jgi:tRNA A37 threonylcarbamoyladenosine synthetase subunit TsaC/SUA5/YrdC
MKAYLPGPYTFILNASSNVPKILKQKTKNSWNQNAGQQHHPGDCTQLGHPILTTSLKEEDEILEYSTDPAVIHDEYKDLVDLVIDGGYGGLVPSTIVLTAPETSRCFGP